MIKQPNVILGNSSLLVTMGRKGEIFGFFYPRRDHAQHVEESLACIYIDGELKWLNGIEWMSKQDYIENTNIVITTLIHKGINISITDFVLPDIPVMVRKFKICTNRRLQGKFFYFSKFNVGEMQNKNSNLCDLKYRMLIQYWQNTHIGIKGSPPFDEWQVGKALDIIYWTNAKIDLEDGILQKNMEDIGNLNMAAGWGIDIDKDESKEITVYIGVSNNRRNIYKFLEKISEKSTINLYEKTKQFWREWLDRPLVNPEFKGYTKNLSLPYNRALLTLNLLNDPEEGSFIAAPEFDHGFEKCGGYGYCWNRDSSKIVLALTNAGYPEFARLFFRWCKKTQMHDGSWFQRYWLNGDIAPSWCNFEYSTQIDETAVTLYAFNEYIKTLSSIKKEFFLDEIWLSILQGAEYLMKRTKKGLHEPCMDLWETYYGTFSYTCASIYAGLKAAAEMAFEQKETGLGQRWSERAEFIKYQTLDNLWLHEGYFAKGIIDNKLDPTVDSSILGTIIPFRLLNPENEWELKMIKSIIETIEDKLSIHVNGSYGISRYENDHYIEGNPWIVLTLWLSKTLLFLAKYDTKSAPEFIKRAMSYIEWSLKGTTSPGLFPEQVDKHTGRPVWAIPLGWSNSLFIENVQLLEELNKEQLII